MMKVEARATVSTPQPRVLSNMNSKDEAGDEIPWPRLLRHKDRSKTSGEKKSRHTRSHRNRKIRQGLGRKGEKGGQGEGRETG